MPPVSAICPFPNLFFLISFVLRTVLLRLRVLGVFACGVFMLLSAQVKFMTNSLMIDKNPPQPHRISFLPSPPPGSSFFIAGSDKYFSSEYYRLGILHVIYVPSHVSYSSLSTQVCRSNTSSFSARSVLPPGSASRAMGVQVRSKNEKANKDPGFKRF
jgi:hypothetical protein